MVENQLGFLVETKFSKTRLEFIFKYIAKEFKIDSTIKDSTSNKILV